MNAVLEAEQQIEAIEEVHGRGLESGPLLRFDGARGHGLLGDLLEMWRESAKREVSIRSLALADEPQYFRIIDDEGGLPIGHLWAEEDVEEPFRGPDRPALVAERLLAADHEQRIARERVDGLHPSAFEDGKAAEGIHVEPTYLRRWQ